jgi:hypothetical protein
MFRFASVFPTTAPHDGCFFWGDETPTTVADRLNTISTLLWGIAATCPQTWDHSARDLWSQHSRRVWEAVTKSAGVRPPSAMHSFSHLLAPVAIPDVLRLAAVSCNEISAILRPLPARVIGVLETSGVLETIHRSAISLCERAHHESARSKRELWTWAGLGIHHIRGMCRDIEPLLCGRANARRGRREDAELAWRFRTGGDLTGRLVTGGEYRVAQLGTRLGGDRRDQHAPGGSPIGPERRFQQRRR